MKHSCVTCRYNNSHSELCHNCNITKMTETETEMSNWTPKTKAQKLEESFDVDNSKIKGDIMTGYSYPIIDSDNIFGEGLYVKKEKEKKEMPPKSYQEYYSLKSLEIKDVIFNDPATIVLWSDGTKTVVKCGKDDTFDPEKGLAMAIVKKFMGTNKSKSNYCDIFKKWIPEETVGEELTKITFLTAKEASEKFGISYKKILKDISEGKIIADKDRKGHWMIPVLDDLLK